VSRLHLIDADHPLAESSSERAVAEGFVTTVSPGDDDLEADRLLIAELVRSHPNIADRHCRPGHLTGSALVVDAAGDHLALVFHTKLQRWLQPGGHADGDTNLAAVALREATEEIGVSGLRIDPRPLDLDIHLVRPPREDPHLHLDVRFLVVAPVGSVLAANHESEALRWVRWDELDRYDPDPGLRRLASAARIAVSEG